MRDSLTPLALLLAGCVGLEPGEDVAYMFDDPGGRFTEEDRAAVVAALGEWRDGLGGGRVDFHEVSEKGPDVLVVFRPTTRAALEAGGDAGKVGGTSVDSWARGGGVRLPTDVSPERLRNIAAHEVGHALGLGHLGEGTVMAPYVEWSPPELSCEDAEAYCEVNECGPGTPAACL